MSGISAAEQAAITAASTGRNSCLCQADGQDETHQEGQPVSRIQVDRLKAYATQHPERSIIYSIPEGIWMAALRTFLPASAEAWLEDPWNVPKDADLRHAAGLDELLDDLGAPPIAGLS